MTFCHAGTKPMSYGLNPLFAAPEGPNFDWETGIDSKIAGRNMQSIYHYGPIGDHLGLKWKSRFCSIATVQIYYIMHEKPAFSQPKPTRSKPRCNTCNNTLDRIPRTLFMKKFLFWLPIRNYFCYRCLTNKVVLKKKKGKPSDDYTTLKLFSSQ